MYPKSITKIKKRGKSRKKQEKRVEEFFLGKKQALKPAIADLFNLQ